MIFENNVKKYIGMFHIINEKELNDIDFESLYALLLRVDKREIKDERTGHYLWG